MYSGVSSGMMCFRAGLQKCEVGQALAAGGGFQRTNCRGERLTSSPDLAMCRGCTFLAVKGERFPS